jgi:hypothetical protein
MKVRHILFFVLVTISQGIYAQFYDTGQDPSSLKWLQIKTKRFTLIYPASYGEEGIKYAKSLDESLIKLKYLYPDYKIRIPVIIHNYTTFSNGYVAWAPKRMEIYPTPEQNGIPLDPKEQLTTHELTHVHQMTSLNKGFTRAMSVITGDAFQGAVSVFLPLWFMEGDAVFAESLLSPSGRGKTASFQKGMKAISLENPKVYSYDKMISGSFKNMVPDHYEFGYQMVAWSVAKHNHSLWNKTLDYTGKYPFTVNPVNFSLKGNANLLKSRLFYESFDSLKAIWQKEEAVNKPVVYSVYNSPKKKEFVNYYSPVIVGKDSVISIKTSLGRPPEFVLMNLAGKSEKRVAIPGSMYPYFISGANGIIVWVEERPDPRWENRNFSVIMIKDIRSNVTRQLTKRSRYLAASVSNDGKLIAASENTIKNENNLVLIDAGSGEILNKITVPGNAFAQRPQWSQNGTEVTIISNSEKGEGIMSYSLKKNEWNMLIPPGRSDLQSGLIRNDSLYFVSSSSGIDNLYILTPEKKLLQLTNSKYGAYDPCPADGKVIFSDYSSTGNNICMTEINKSRPYFYSEGKNPAFLIDRFDTIKIKDSNLPLTNYKPERYRKIGHVLGIHSWMPFYADLETIQVDPTAVRPGINIMSQNQLSTVIASVGYEYAADKTNQIHTRATIKEWVPVIESQLNYGARSDIKKKEGDPDPEQITPALSFINTLYLPLSFSTGRFGQYLQPTISSNYNNTYIYQSDKKTYDYGQLELTGRLYFINYFVSSMRDLYPRWAQVIDYSYSYYPVDMTLLGNIRTLKTAFFFPGLFRNHSLKLRFENEVQNPQKYILMNRASFPRGYYNIISEKLRLYSADYAMPLFYPDLNIPWTLFVKRIRGGLFYDYGEGTNNTYYSSTTPVNHKYTETFRSFGGEILADFYFLRMPFLISAGVQSVWKDLNETPELKLLFNIDLFGMKIGRNRPKI